MTNKNSRRQDEAGGIIQGTNSIGLKQKDDLLARTSLEDDEEKIDIMETPKLALKPPVVPSALLPRLCELYRDDFCCLGFSEPPECEGLCSTSSDYSPLSVKSGWGVGPATISRRAAESYRSMEHWVVQPASRAGVAFLGDESKGGGTPTSHQKHNYSSGTGGSLGFWATFWKHCGPFVPWYGAIAVFVCARAVIAAASWDVLF